MSYLKPVYLNYRKHHRPKKHHAIPYAIVVAAIQDRIALSLVRTARLRNAERMQESMRKKHTTDCGEYRTLMGGKDHASHDQCEAHSIQEQI